VVRCGVDANGMERRANLKGELRQLGEREGDELTIGWPWPSSLRPSAKQTHRHGPELWCAATLLRVLGCWAAGLLAARHCTTGELQSALGGGGMHQIDEPGSERGLALHVGSGGRRSEGREVVRAFLGRR
jgi:hypothetical protein